MLDRNMTQIVSDQKERESPQNAKLFFRENHNAVFLEIWFFLAAVWVEISFNMREVCTAIF